MFDKKEAEIEISSPSRVKPLIGALLVLVSVFAYIFFLRPISAELSTIEADVLAKNTQADQITAQIQQYIAASEQLDLSTEVERLEILKTVPKEMDQDEVIRDLIDIARNYDIALNSLSFGQGMSGKEGVSTLRINASFEGNYADLTTFLEGIESNTRMFRVNSISVQINTLDISDIKRATFSLSMEAFYQNKNQ